MTLLKLSHDAAEKINIGKVFILAPIFSEKSCNYHRNTDRTTITRIAYQTVLFPNQPIDYSKLQSESYLVLLFNLSCLEVFKA